MRKFILSVAIAIIFCSCMIWLIGTNEAERNSTAMSSAGAISELQQVVKQRATQVYVKPIEPRIDRVWKLIPGLNGRMLEEQKTINASKVSWQHSKELNEIYRTLTPLQPLESLPPAPIYRANPEKLAVAFMVNVAWGNEHIPHMLETFRVKQAKATFFLDGSWLSKNAELAKRMMKAGHELSNHGYSHKNMSQLSNELANGEIVKTERLLNELGVKNRLFAPPSGDFDDDTVAIARKHNLLTILWTVDTVDWKRPPAQQIISKVRKELTPGALVLMHPTASTAQALPQLIDDARERGFTIDTVSRTISPNRMQFVE